MPDISREDQTSLNQLRFVWSEFYAVYFKDGVWTARHHNARPWSKPLTAVSFIDMREKLENDWSARQATRRRRG